MNNNFLLLLELERAIQHINTDIYTIQEKKRIRKIIRKNGSFVTLESDGFYICVKFLGMNIWDTIENHKRNKDICLETYIWKKIIDIANTLYDELVIKK